MQTTMSVQLECAQEKMIDPKLALINIVTSAEKEECRQSFLHEQVYVYCLLIGEKVLISFYNRI